MTLIEIPDERAAALKAKAAAQVCTLEVWLKKLAEGGTGGFTALDWSQCAAVERRNHEPVFYLVTLIIEIHG